MRPLLRVVGGCAGWVFSAEVAQAARVGRVLRRSWRVVAAALGPVMAVASLPAIAVAVAAVGLSAASVAVSETPAQAATPPGKALVLVQNGETTAPETTALEAAGWTVTQATPAQWEADSLSTFQGYAALVIGDPSTTSACSPLTPTTATSGTDALGTTWQQAVKGNVAVLGTAPAAAGSTAANALVTDAVSYAAAGFNSANNTGTGLYVSLNCEYKWASPKTGVPLLNAVEGIGTAGGLTVQGGLSCSDAGTVNKWEAGTAGTFGGFTSGSLGTGSWPSPGCPVQEAFNAWPAMFTPVAYDAASDATANFTASDGVSGQPVVLLGTPVSAATAALAPSNGGEVLAGTTSGGAINPATPGVSQATAADPVNTENGDFTQSDADLSTPTFGPALGFTRDYDSGVAREETVAGKPGPLGYGWTDNLATSLTLHRPVPGDIYTINTPGVSLGDPQDMAADPAGDVFVADTTDNDVVEVAATSHTQFGIAMTAGNAYVVAGSAAGTAGSSGDGGLATSALLASPEGVTVDAAGNLYVADSENSRIQEVAAATGTQFGQSMTIGHAYTIAGSASGTQGSSGDGGKATSALLSMPSQVRTDTQGNVYITDSSNNRVQEVAAVTGTQRGVAMTAGDMYTIAGSAGSCCGSGDGGPATSASFSYPEGLALDASGDVYVTDSSTDVVREIAGTTGTQRGQAMTANDIYTVAGTPSAAGTGGNGGSATAAQLSGPAAVAVDSSGDLYIADTSNSRIQEVPAASGTQWGQSMTVGDIYTVAGSAAGTAGPGGDGGPAIAATLSEPLGLGTDPNGDLLIPDSGNTAIREVFASTGQLFTTSPAGTGITITQGDGSQVNFIAKTGSPAACTAPYVSVGVSGFCTLPQNTGAALTFNSTAGTYTYAPTPDGTSYTYSATSGVLLSEADTAGDTLTVTARTPAPGSGNCPSAASSCQTAAAADGRTLVIGSNAGGLVTSVTDPLGRRWAYAYNSASQLTSATDPAGHITSYTYGAGGTGNPQLSSDLLTITSPNGQAGGPDAGDATVNVYDSLGRVTTQTDPMGFKTTFNYCVNAATGNCINPATGTGFVTVTGPDGNHTVYDYDLGTLAAQSSFTGTTPTSETDSVPDTTAASSSNPSGGSLLDTAATDGNGNLITTSYDNFGMQTADSSPAPNGTLGEATTQYTASLRLAKCESSAITASTATCPQDPSPGVVTAGGAIAPPSSAPPQGVTYTEYDSDGNDLYTTTGVYEPGATTAAYSRTTYQLFRGNTVTLNGTTVSCASTPPSPSLACAHINADGVVTQLGYDSAGDLTSSSTPDGNGSEVATTTYAYDGDGEQTSTTAPDGKLSGDTAATTANFTTVTAYNADGQKTTVTQAGGSGATVTPRTISYGYDGDSNQTTVKDARGNTTTTAYNADDEATLVTNPDGNSTLTCYDGDSDTAQTVPAIGVAANSLAASSCPASYPAGYGDRLAPDATTDTYDADGNRTASTTPAPAGLSGDESTTYTYDAAGNLIKTDAPPSSNASGAPDNVTIDTYNSSNQRTSETTGYGTSAAATVGYCYDPDGNKTAVVYGDGNTTGTAPCETSSPWVVSPTSNPAQAAYQTTYAYDSAGEQVSTTTPATAAASNGATTTMTYDPAGNERTKTDPNGVQTTYTYTPTGQEATVTYSGSSAHPVSYTYDANGNQTAMTDASGSSSYIFDPFGELSSTTNGSNQTTGYTYDADGDIAGITYPLPASASWATTHTLNYGYDNADQLTSAADFTGNKITITPDADGQQKSETLGSTGDTIATSDDNTDAPQSITLKNSSTTLQSFTYSDSPAGTILSETDNPSSPRSPAVYAYDAQGRVASLTPGTGSTLNYGFDPSFNLTTLPSGASTSYDKAGELTSSALAGTTTSYTYNADGEQLTAVQGSTATSAATWNGAGQLAVYDNTAADMTAATYDGRGLRAATTITPSGGSAVTQGYVWNALPQTPQLLMDGVNAYVYTTGTAPAEQVSLATGAITYLVADRLGSIRGTVSPTGALTANTAYDAWGNPETTGGLTATTPFGFAGGYTDPSGLIYLVNRYYSPQLGQFTSVDPDLASTLQPYAYAGDNPVTNADPTGLYEAVEYRPKCSAIGCVNIVKFCKDATLAHCALYWNTSVEPAYKNATDANLYITIQVQGRNVTSYPYSHSLNANRLPFFHGQWGFQTSTLGQYSYPCWVVGTCTGYLKGSDDVEFGGAGTWHRNGVKGITIYGKWGENTGTKGPWFGGAQKWARLPY